MNTDIVDRIQGNRELDLIDERIIDDLVKHLLPFKYGGRWKAELHPGIFEYRPLNVTEHEQKCKVSHATYWRRMKRLESVGLYESYHFKSERKVPLVDIKGLPLLAHPERISFKNDFCLFHCEISINTYPTPCQVKTLLSLIYNVV